MNRSGLIRKFEKVTGVGAEIGVYRGDYAREILSGYRGTLICVDRWDGVTIGLGEQDWTAVFAAFSGVVRDFPGRVDVRKGWSVERASEVPDGALDFVYIDADHQYAAVKADIEAWFPKVRAGGIISGHDYLEAGFPKDPEQGVNEAVDEFFAARGLKVNFTNERKWLSWWVVKNAV